MAQPIQNAKIQQLIGTRPTAPQTKQVGQTGDFNNILADRLKVSGHAQTRLQSRNIELDAEQWKRVMEGVDRAEGKGAKESLVLLDDIAMIVSVRNRTVITAVDREQLKENVFTNIDSAVIV